MDEEPAVNSRRKRYDSINNNRFKDSVRRQYHSSAIIERLTIAHALLLVI